MTLPRLPRALLLAALACAGMAAWITFDLSHWWRMKEDYSFGFLVPIFSLYVISERWGRIQALFAPSGTPDAGGKTVRWMDWLGLAALCGALVFFVFGALYRGFTGPTLPGSMVMTLGFAGTILSAALVFSDRRTDGTPLAARERFEFVGILLFPSLVWILSAPLMSALETAVSVFLLGKVTTVVFGIYDALGMIIERQGSTLILPDGHVGVEEACSGIRSLTGCLFAGSFLAAVFLEKFWKKVLMVSMALLFAILTNLARSLFLTGWAYAHGAQSIEGTLHDATGYAVLGITVVLLLCLIPLFNFKLPEPPAAPGGSPKDAAQKSARPEASEEGEGKSR